MEKIQSLTKDSATMDKVGQCINTLNKTNDNTVSLSNSKIIINQNTTTVDDSAGAKLPPPPSINSATIKQQHGHLVTKYGTTKEIPASVSDKQSLRVKYSAVVRATKSGETEANKIDEETEPISTSDVYDENGELINENWTTVIHNKNKDRNKKINKIGNVKIKKNYITGSSNKTTLTTVEKINFLFVSRLGDNMECSDVLNYLQDYKSANYEIEKLKTKHPGYSSFKIGVPISSFDIIYSPEFWPLGTFVSKFRFPKTNLNKRAASSEDKT